MANLLGSGTSLVTLYIPGNTLYNQAIQLLKSELTAAQNIKDKKIQSCRQTMVPSNGIVLCAGETRYRV